MYKIISFGALALATILFLSLKNLPGKIKLFQPDRKSEWHLYLSKTNRNDPKGVFLFEDGMLHVSGEDFGYVITEKKFSEFHFTVEFKWGEKKYPPRQNAKRDAGILYHAVLYSGDKVWPRSLEFQIQEADCGDFWMTDSTIIRHNDTLTFPNKGAHRAAKTKDAENPHGEWNRAEVIVRNGKITHLLNGQLVNEGNLVNTKDGAIVLQSEGAEIYYRNAEIEEL